MERKFMIVCILSMLLDFQSKAYDFYFTNSDGVRIYYDFLGGAGNKVMVVEGSQLYSGIVNIPDSVLYDGTKYSVEEIGSRAFFSCWELTKVTLPPKLTTIREFAFSRCDKLTNIILPDGVTTIRDRAFEQCITLSNVSFGRNLSTIGYYAFSQCEDLESIELGDKLTTIDPFAFNGCLSLKKISLPGSLTEISEGVFGGCTSLEEISIPNSVTKIGVCAFVECVGLKSFTVPNSVTSIDVAAFFRCSNLESLVLGEKVSFIGKDAFKNCLGLKKIEVSEKNTNYSSIDGILADKEKTTLLQFPNAKTSDFNVPDMIKIIGEDAFAGCENIKTIILPEHVTTISPRAFAECINLTNIKVGNNIDSIGPRAFQDCNSLEGFALSEKLSHIADSAFLFCTGLKSIIIPNGVKTIGISAFNGSKGMNNKTIGYGVQTIGDWAFWGCSGIIDTLFIPDNVTDVGYSAFGYNWASVLIIGKKVEKIGDDAFVYMMQLKVVYNCNPVPQVTNDVFYHYPYYIEPRILYVPFGSKNSYENAGLWSYKKYFNIIEEKEYIVSNETIHQEHVIISNTNGGLMISAAAPANVAIYAINGQMVYNEYLNDMKEIRLPRGLYIVKTKSMEKKVYVE